MSLERQGSIKTTAAGVELSSGSGVSPARCATTRVMHDLLFIALVVGFFALATLFVAGCERIVGRSQDEGDAR